MKKLNIMSLDFTYKAQVAGFESAILTRKWNGINTLTFTMNSEITNADLIELDDVVWFDNEYSKAFIVERKEEKLTGNTVEYTFSCLGLETLLKDFVTVPPDDKYEIVTGTREVVVRTWVTTNCITRNSQYPIVLGSVASLGETVTEQTRYKNLFEEIQRVLLPEEFSFNLTVNLDDSEYTFNVVEGTDRTTSAPTYAPRVIFGLAYGNLEDYQKINDTSATKNYAFVGGSGESDARTIVTVDVSTDRVREVFVDARDLSDTDELAERGSQSLAELLEVDSFDFNVLDRQFTYETNYDLGDYVTVVLSTSTSKDLQIQEVQEVYEKGNIKIKPSFGVTDKTLSKVIGSINQRLTQVENV